jgi:hypothetical protein
VPRSRCRDVSLLQASYTEYTIKNLPGNRRLSAAEEWENGGNHGVRSCVIAVYSASPCGKYWFVIHLFLCDAVDRLCSYGAGLGQMPLPFYGSRSPRKKERQHHARFDMAGSDSPGLYPGLSRSICVGRRLATSGRHPANRVRSSLRILYHGVVCHQLSCETQAVAFTRQ